ncbi:MAG: NAD-dependent epimerase/dehydratase family protein [Planctomycetaceae bacterium]|jgi:farnesol dehydrogenase|nr:NAD-dependent epimerase/dehydratase family protein [Planctomycetaceae bacterium]
MSIEIGVGDRVFITGGTGFIGSKLTAELLRRGCSVKVMTRNLSGLSDNKNDNLEYVSGDVTDVDSLRRAMSGCNYVFHLAGYAKNWAKDSRIYDEINIEGTRNVFNVAAEVGAERVVWTSTIVTFGATENGVIGDEKTVRTNDNFFTEYERSKTIMEREALKLAANGFPLVIVNPTRVYGPGVMSESNAVTQLISMIRNGKMPTVLNFGRNIGNYVYIDDVVFGLILALEGGRVGERYILGGDNVKLGEVFTTVDKVDGVKRRFRWGIYYRTPLLIAYISEWLANTFGIYPFFTSGWIKTFLADWAFSSKKAETELGYKSTPFEEGVKKTCQWLDENKIK